MSTFAFKALDLNGATSRGEVEAEDKQSVAAQLRQKGLIVLDIEEQKPTDVGDILGRFKRVKATELTVATRQVRQLTDGVHDEHSIDWSPNGQEILLVSNREADADQFFNNDLFASDLVARLETVGMEVFLPRQAPTGDWGIALGQVLVANATVAH